MKELVGLCNVYIDSLRKPGSSPNNLLLKNIAMYITRMLRVSFLCRPTSSTVAHLLYNCIHTVAQNVDLL